MSQQNPRNTLKIANQYGNFDVVHDVVPKGYTLVRGARLQPICRKHKISFVPAVTEWAYSGYRKHGSKPQIGGVVVTKKGAVKLQAILALHSSPQEIAKREDAAAKRMERAERKRKEWEEVCYQHGIHDADGLTAKALKKGEIDSFKAKLIAFKTRYRHEFTDYDSRLDSIRDIDRNDFASYDEFHFAKDDAYIAAREGKEEDLIPNDWTSYLAKYGFNSDIAVAMSQVLQEPTKCHPVWFCACMLGLEACGDDLENLTYERIRDAKLRLHD